jgi:hypothetical protein
MTVGPEHPPEQRIRGHPKNNSIVQPGDGVTLDEGAQLFTSKQEVLQFLVRAGETRVDGLRTGALFGFGGRKGDHFTAIKTTEELWSKHGSTYKYFSTSDAVAGRKLYTGGFTLQATDTPLTKLLEQSCWSTAGTPTCGHLLP